MNTQINFFLSPVLSIGLLLMVSTFDLRAETQKVTITGNDQMKFNITEIKASPKQQIELTFKNIGKMPKQSMGHNVVFLKAKVNAAQFIREAVKHKDNEYIPPKRESDILAKTKMLGPGQSETITFSAPETPGNYEYVCTFPAHYMVGMKGLLIVE